MLQIVIFGTGSSAERAWQAAAARADVSVICFADNDPRKQGTTLHGRPVVSADDLRRQTCDAIVIASMYAREIGSQLAALGIDGSSVTAAENGAFAECLAQLAARKAAAGQFTFSDGSSISRSNLPETLILTYETLNSSHGTGVLLQRYFGEFPPEKLFSLCHTVTGQPWLERSLALPAAGSTEERAATLRRELEARAFAPRLIYATAFNENDLDLLDIVVRALPGVPIVQHFMDYMPHDADAFDARFRELRTSVADVWALTEGLAGELGRRYSRHVRLVTALHQDPADESKTEHRAVDASFRAVILGNLWQPWMLPVVRGVWRRCQAAIPGLRPIDWYVHPARVQSLIDAGYELGDEVVWRGFYGGRALQERLRNADLALLPFNMQAEAADGYTKYSLPSRLTELCGAGLPIFAIASADTEPSRFLRTRACGVSASGPDEDRIAEQLIAVIRDRDTRATLGARARHVAEVDFAFGPFQQQLIRDFIEISTPVQTRRSA